jgi:hypothetical protein
MGQQNFTDILRASYVDGPTLTAAAEALLFPDYTFPADWWKVERAVRLTMYGRASNAVTTPGTIQFRLRWGGLAGILLCDSGALTQNVAVQTNKTWFAAVPHHLPRGGLRHGRLALRDRAWAARQQVRRGAHRHGARSVPAGHARGGRCGHERGDGAVDHRDAVAHDRVDHRASLPPRGDAVDALRPLAVRRLHDDARAPRSLATFDAVATRLDRRRDGSIWSHAASLGTYVKGSEFTIDRPLIENFVRVFASGYPRRCPSTTTTARRTARPEAARRCPKAGDVLELRGVFAPADFTGELKRGGARSSPTRPAARSTTRRTSGSGCAGGRRTARSG